MWWLTVGRSEEDGTVVWALPEILLYDDAPPGGGGAVAFLPPRDARAALVSGDEPLEFVAAAGSAVRLHRVDVRVATLLPRQFAISERPDRVPLFALDASDLGPGRRARAPALPDLGARGGYSLVFVLDDPPAGSVLDAMRDVGGAPRARRGYALTAADGALAFEMADGAGAPLVRAIDGARAARAESNHRGAFEFFKILVPPSNRARFPQFLDRLSSLFKFSTTGERESLNIRSGTLTLKVS